MNLLEFIDEPHHLRALPRAQLAALARQLRRFPLASVARTGGYLASNLAWNLSSNLGTVEPTIVLHDVFDTPRDRIALDGGHQAYGHKVLTGRRAHMAARAPCSAAHGLTGADFPPCASAR